MNCNITEKEYTTWRTKRLNTKKGAEQLTDYLRDQGTDEDVRYILWWLQGDYGFFEAKEYAIGAVRGIASRSENEAEILAHLVAYEL